MRRTMALGATLWILGCGGGNESEPVGERSPAAAATAGFAEPAEAIEATRPTEATDASGAPSTAGVAGRWREIEGPASIPSELAEQIEALESLGYSSGQTEARDQVGVTRWDPERSAPGWNLYTSGHGPEAILMDMEGNELHRWRRDYLEIWPGRKKNQVGQEYWRRARLLPDGDLVVLFEGQGIARLDVDSQVKWARHQRSHHDVTVLESGEIWVLERIARMLPHVDPDRATLEDLVTMLRPDGTLIRTVSLLECLENSPDLDWRSLSADFTASAASRLLNAKAGDIFHTNSILALNPDQGPGPPGPNRALFSFRHLDLVAVVDLEQRHATWWVAGLTAAQHDAQRTWRGTVSAFDNLWAPGRSRVVEIDPDTRDVVWEYGSGAQDEPFLSRECGSVRILENGNALVTETDQGRAFEVTRDGERVWEFTNPRRAGEGDRYVASIFGLARVPIESTASWLVLGD
ncbi:MAG: hypothetical protein DHS20C21_06290 [Gemmatimonadota bacterium]|nr:MAG: hypothetical protein DHS20C21_06290 [Gemmatimonadota bacterium]